MGDQNTKFNFQPESNTSARLLQNIQKSPKDCFTLVKSQEKIASQELEGSSLF